MAVSINLSITQNSQNKDNLTSNCTIKLTASWTYGSYNKDDCSGWVKIDGTKYTFTSDFNSGQSTSGSETIFTKTLNIKHNTTTGNKTLECSASFATDVSSGTVTDSASKTLTQLPAYTVTYKANGGSGVPSKQYKYYNKELTLSSTKPTRSGYTFVGWGTSATDTTYNYKAGGTYSGNADEILYAIWSKTITLTYNANGGGGAPASQTGTIYNATTSKTFNISDTKPTKSGYTFLGWSKTSTATSATYTTTDTISLSANDTLYAIWKKTITLTYSANGGSGAPSSQSATVYNSTTSKTFTISSTKPTRSGYTFVGWSKSSTATSSSYSPSDSITLSSSDTLYAIWKKTITLSYNANGGTGVPSSQSATIYNATTSYKFTLSSTKPTRTGYTFKGWSTSSTATSASYSAKGTITLSSSDTLYAVWSVNTLTINYYSNFADYCELDVDVSLSTNVKVYTSTHNYGTSYTNGVANYTASGGSCHMTRTGYNGTGYWNTLGDEYRVNQDQAYTGQAMAKALGKDISNGSATVGLYAEWSIKKYTISYNANGGSGAPASQTKIYGTTLTLSSTKPTRTGYTFQGWGTSASDTSVNYNPGGSYTANSAATLYAIWKINTYTVSYDANGGTNAPASQTKTYGVTLTLSSSKPTRPGYRFVGWGTTTTDTTVNYNPGGTFTANYNEVLYAIWEQLGILHINQNGTWGKGKVWIKVDGVWKTGLVYTKVNNVWRQGGL